MVGYDTQGCETSRFYAARPDGSKLEILVVRPAEKRVGPAPGVLWLHGGGYLLGFPRMVFMGRAADLVRECGAVVASPAYRLSTLHPYPAALEDAYLALEWLRDRAEFLGIRPDQLMVGGESAGGGLAAATCLYARDHGGPRVAFQMPLYPMLDCRDTPSSEDNHAKVWNTRRNHLAWHLYLRSVRGEVPPYASPALAQDLSGLPACYTFVGDVEPFFCETLAYVEGLRAAGVDAEVDVYKGAYHAFDMMEPSAPMAQTMKARFIEAFKTAEKSRFAPQR
jgi:acetyl esterase/lipase